MGIISVLVMLAAAILITAVTLYPEKRKRQDNKGGGTA